MKTWSNISGIAVVPSGSLPTRPFIGVIGGIHGNEPCGIKVIRGLSDPSHPLRRRLSRGTLFLIHGNPKACRQRSRHSEGGDDLNRQFAFEFESQLREEEWSYEQRRAIELRPILEQLDAVLDIHSATVRSQPFVITSSRYLPLASRLGCEYLTHGWEGPGLLTNQFMNDVVLRRGNPAFAVECGRHGDAETVAVAWRVTEHFLHAMCVLDGPPPPCPPLAHTVVELYHRLPKPTESFSFSRDYVGFDAIAPGELVGEDRGIRLVARDSFLAVLPNPNVAVGEDMLFLGKACSVTTEIAPSRRYRELFLASDHI